jgi:hypothetical protein
MIIIYQSSTTLDQEMLVEIECDAMVDTEE